MPILRYVKSGFLTSPANSQTTGTVMCPAEAPFVIGGGNLSTSGAPGVENVNSSLPVNNDSWRVDIDNTSAATASFTVYAICTNSNDAAASVSALPQKR